MEKLDYLFGVLAYETPNGLTIKLKYAGEYIEEEKSKNAINSNGTHTKSAIGRR